MDIEKNFEIIELFEIYGELLTKRQQQIMREYFEYDLSLSEIADNEGISRSAVQDTIKKSKSQLEKFEKILKIQKKNQEINKIIEDKKLSKEEMIKLLKGVK